MTNINCPSCGHELAVDVLTKEPRPCPQCGSVATVDETGRLIPDAEHQGNINRQKFFEIATVIVLIIVGFGYFAISNGRTFNQASGSTTTPDLSAILRSENFVSEDAFNALGKTVHSFHAQGDLLYTSIDLIAENGSDETEAIIVVADLPAGTPFPSDDITGHAVQETFDEITRLGELLIPSSTQSLSKAVSTTVPVSNGSTRFHKGVAQTNSGWKITYIAYRAYEENGKDIPLLLFIYQRLDAASDPTQESFNQILFNAANNGVNIRQAILDHAEGEPVEQ